MGKLLPPPIGRKDRDKITVNPAQIMSFSLFNYLQPGRKIGCHDDDGILELSIHLCGQLGVDELVRVDDGPVVGGGVERAPVAVQSVKRPQEAEDLERGVLDVHELGELADQEGIQWVQSFRRVPF